MMISRVDGCYGSSSLSPSDHDNFFFYFASMIGGVCVNIKVKRKNTGLVVGDFFFRQGGWWWLIDGSNQQIMSTVTCRFKASKEIFKMT